MRNRTIKAHNDALAHLVGEKMDVPGDDLSTVIDRAGRALPRRLRKDAAYLTLTETMAGHPRLYHLVDKKRRKRADRGLRAYVRDLDPAQERWDRTLGVIAGIVFGLLVFFALLVTVLAWRGVIGPG